MKPLFGKELEERYKSNIRAFASMYDIYIEEGRELEAIVAHYLVRPQNKEEDLASFIMHEYGFDYNVTWHEISKQKEKLEKSKIGQTEIADYL